MFNSATRFVCLSFLRDTKCRVQNEAFVYEVDIVWDTEQIVYDKYSICENNAVLF